MISMNSAAVGIPALTEHPAPISRIQALSRSLARLTVSRTSAISRCMRGPSLGTSQTLSAHLILLLPPARFQRATSRLGGDRSMQLSYESTSNGIVNGEE